MKTADLKVKKKLFPVFFLAFDTYESSTYFDFLINRIFLDVSVLHVELFISRESPLQ